MSIKEFDDFNSDTIVISTNKTRDKYNNITYATDTNYNARVVYKGQQVFDLQGNEIYARGHVWIPSLVDIDIESKITLPDNSTPKILNYEIHNGKVDLPHTKVWFR